MYFTISNQSKLVPTLLSSLNRLGFLLIFTARFTSISGRNVHNHFLYSGLNPELLDPGSVDQSLLDEWADVQPFWHSVQSDLQPTTSRQHVEPKAVSGSPAYGVASSYSTPPPAPLLNQDDLAELHRRDTFSSNVCTISVQTTVYVSIDGASTVTLSSIVGPRPTGTPGDTGTSDGTDTAGGVNGTGTAGGQSFGNKEGLITGLGLVLLILLASLYALCMYFYRKRRNTRLQRMSTQPHSDTADIALRMGPKGLASLSNSARNFSRSRRWSQWSPPTFFRGLVSRLKPSSRRNPDRNNQSSELRERKRRMEQPDRGNTAVAENPAAEPEHSANRLGVQPTEKSSSGNTIPEMISSPALSWFKLLSPPKPVARLSAGEHGPVDDVPLVTRRVPPNYLPALSALQPIAVEPNRLGSNPDFGRDASPQRSSQGKPLSPSAWMAGVGVASGSHVDPFANPSYVPPSDHRDSVQSTSRVSEPGSPLSNAHSSESDRTLRRRQTSPQRQNYERLSAVIEPSDVRPEGASDIILTVGSAFEDRPSDHHTVSTLDDDRRPSESLLVRYDPHSDVEEVLTPVADERLSTQPGSAPFTWRETRDSSEQRSARSAHISTSPVQRSAERPLSQPSEFVDPFTDSDAPPSLPPPPMSRGRGPVPLQRKPEATSIRGGLLPSENSASTSLTGTSIVDLGPPIDTGDWDDDASRRQEEGQLFYTRPDTAASNQLDSNHTH